MNIFFSIQTENAYNVAYFYVKVANSSNYRIAFNCDDPLYELNRTLLTDFKVLPTENVNHSVKIDIQHYKNFIITNSLRAGHRKKLAEELIELHLKGNDSRLTLLNEIENEISLLKSKKSKELSRKAKQRWKEKKIKDELRAKEEIKQKLKRYAEKITEVNLYTFDQMFGEYYYEDYSRDECKRILDYANNYINQ